MTLDPNDQAHRLGCKVGTMAASLLHAANHKATNDLALWLYIYHYEGLTATSYALMFLAILSNHPGRWHRSFAYNAANYYIGEAIYHMLHLLHLQLVCSHVLGSFWLSTGKPIRVASARLALCDIATNFGSMKWLYVPFTGVHRLHRTQDSAFLTAYAVHC